MKLVPVCIASTCALILLTGCTSWESPEKLIAAANKYHANKQYQEASILYQKAIAKDKVNAEAYYRGGLNFLDDGKIREAVQFLRRAVDLKPNNLDATTKLADIYIAAYQADPRRNQSVLPDAEELDKKILANNPNSFDGLRLRALLTFVKGQYENSIPLFEKANQMKPYSRDVVFWWAQAYRQVQQSDKAMALVNDMLAHDKSWSQGYQLLFVYYSQLGDKTKAEEVLRDNAKNDPSNEIALVNYANFLAANKRAGEGETVIRQALNNPKAFPKARLMVGDYYVRISQFDKAIAEYKTGANEDSKNAVTYKERLVALEAFRNHPAEAARMAKELAEEHPKDASVNEMYASVLLETGQKEDAKKSLESLKDLVAKNPGDSVLHLDLARAYFGVNDRDKALAEALEALHAEQTLQQKGLGQHAGVMMTAQTIAARIYEDRGQHAKAIEMADVVLNNQPNNAEAILVRDRALIGTNQPDKAQPELENLVKSNPKMNDAHLQLATLYLIQKNFDKARAEYEYLNSQNDMRGFIGLQTVKLNTGKGDEAIQNMQELVDKNPAVLTYRYELANFQASLGGLDWTTNNARAKELYQKAADNYKEILKTTTNSSEIWLRLGIMQRQLLQYDTALASFEQAGNADPKNVAAFLNQALVCEVLGRKKEAVEAYNKVLSIDPDNALVLNNMAYMTADSSGSDTNLDQALTWAERAKKRAPDDPNIADTLGFVYFKKQLFSESFRIFKQLTVEHPQSSLYHLHLAMVMAKQGDKLGAHEETKKALQSAQTPDEKNKAMSFDSQIG